MGDRRFSKKFSVISVGAEDLRTPKKSLGGDGQEAYAGIPTAVVQEDLELADDDEHQLQMFEGEESRQPRMGNWFGKLAAYTGGMEPTTSEAKEMRDKQAKAQPQRRLGSFLGVFLPSCQNIFGILLFVRVGWITGVSSTLQSVAIVIMCCSCTLLTALSMSAIATNGKVPAGGSYFMISRSIGPEFGGAVGILFYLGTTIASAMYLVGAVEVFLKYMCRGCSLFGDINEDSVLFNNTRVYGTILLLLVFVCVLLGIRFVSRFAILGLISVLVSILAMYIGFFTIHESTSPKVCFIGNRLLSQSLTLNLEGVVDCSANVTGPLYKAFCGSNGTSTVCDYFKNNPPRLQAAIQGITSGNTKKNFLQSFYREADEPYTTSPIPLESEFGQGPNIADITTSFTILLAIYFPSVTGIMAGSNRSGDLANPQVSIPLGTICAILFTSFVYITSPILMAAICDGAVMRDKFGESYGGGLLVAAFAWPNKWVVLVGSCLSTIGAGLQCLTGAPRLLQAIAQDNVMPILSVFQVTTKRGEPLRAQLLCYVIAQIGILIASIDALTPLITMFFLMLYGFVNLATMLNGFLKEPSWRPRFRFHHWFLSLIGLALCVALMFISSWIYTLVAWGLAILIYKYIEYRGASKEWGDATRGLHMSTAKRAILKLGDKPTHTKNWRPQILLYVSLDDNMEVRHTRLLDLVYQLKAGHGLTMVACILEGDLSKRKDDANKVKAHLSDLINQHRVRGLAEVLVSSTVGEGMKIMAQCAGLGNLRHNTLMVSFPEDWRAECSQSSGQKLAQFIATIRSAQACDLAVLVAKGIDSFPRSKSLDVGVGCVDVWCIVHDGGLLLLTSYLLMRNRVWRRCKLRIFVVASEDDDVVNLKKDMIKFIYDLRINAEVEVVAMDTADISAYVAQRTANIEQRRELLNAMNLTNMQQRRDPQLIFDQHRRPSSVTGIQVGPVAPGKDPLSVAASTGENGTAQPPSSALSPVSEELTHSTDVSVHPTRNLDDPAVVDALRSETPPLVEEEALLDPKSKSKPANNNKSANTVTFAPDVTDKKASSNLSDSKSVTDANQFTFSANHAVSLAREARRALDGGATSPDEDDEEENEDGGGTATRNPIHDGSLSDRSGSKSSEGKKNRYTKSQRRMHCASRLNELLKSHSSDSSLVIVNMPSPSRTAGASDYNYMDYLEALSESLPRVLFVRGTGREVITAFSE